MCNYDWPVITDEELPLEVEKNFYNSDNPSAKTRIYHDLLTESINPFILEITEDSNDIKKGTRGKLETFPGLTYQMHRTITFNAWQVNYKYVNVVERRIDGSVKSTPYFDWMSHVGIELICPRCGKHLETVMEQICEFDIWGFQRMMNEQRKGRELREERENFAKENPFSDIEITNIKPDYSYMLHIANIKILKHKAAGYAMDYSDFIIYSKDGATGILYAKTANSSKCRRDVTEITFSDDPSDAGLDDIQREIMFPT